MKEIKVRRKGRKKTNYPKSSQLGKIKLIKSIGDGWADTGSPLLHPFVLGKRGVVIPWVRSPLHWPHSCLKACNKRDNWLAIISVIAVRQSCCPRKRKNIRVWIRSRVKDRCKVKIGKWKRTNIVYSLLVTGRVWDVALIFVVDTFFFVQVGRWLWSLSCCRSSRSQRLRHRNEKIFDFEGRILEVGLDYSKAGERSLPWYEFRGDVEGRTASLSLGGGHSPPLLQFV